MFTSTLLFALTLALPQAYNAPVTTTTCTAEAAVLTPVPTPIAYSTALPQNATPIPTNIPVTTAAPIASPTPEVNNQPIQTPSPSTSIDDCQEVATQAPVATEAPVATPAPQGYGINTTAAPALQTGYAVAGGMYGAPLPTGTDSAPQQTGYAVLSSAKTGASALGLFAALLMI